MTLTQAQFLSLKVVLLEQKVNTLEGQLKDTEIRYKIKQAMEDAGLDPYKNYKLNEADFSVEPVES